MFVLFLGNDLKSTFLMSLTGRLYETLFKIDMKCKKSNYFEFIPDKDLNVLYDKQFSNVKIERILPHSTEQLSTKVKETVCFLRPISPELFSDPQLRYHLINSL